MYHHCKLCGKVFVTATALHQHMSTHTVITSNKSNKVETIQVADLL